ncbi:MAG TPA: helicase-related protein [Devosiaceae bacterium]|jgi:ATP-dependent RNA helicase SUPV3L1/SUV3
MDARPSHTIKAVLGPTNTGKTYYAIDRMLAHATGMIGLPLRLLAREVYNRVVERVGVQAVALVTGEERIVPPRARYWVATVEAMPTDIPVECIAIDEVQTAIDFDRGHIFTNRILSARGISETLLLGAGTMAPVIRQLLPNVEIIHRPRLSELTYAGSKKISRQPTRTAIVAFSASQVYAIAELIRRERGGAAVVMGALSPRTRNAQVELYQNGDVDFLVATDAIGMGLNLDVHHVAFADDTKFDGHQTRPLTPAEFGQIAGRAGRHIRNGTFGVTGGADPFEPELIQQLESHDFDAIKVLQWRNADLDFSSLEALRRSLDVTPGHKSLTRVPIATDQHALEFISRNEANRLAVGRDAVHLLWEVCQTPDYRDISPAQHGEIVTRLYSDLRRHGFVDSDWIAEQVRFCDNISGDIDTLSNRIRQVRTWTFVANRKNWLEDPTHWRDRTREIEDRLSDALHEKLIQRFVDRRTSVLIRHLRDKRMVLPEINDRGEVSLEGHLIGTIEGFRFTLSRTDGDGDARQLRSAADQVVAPEIHNRAERLAGAPNEEFVLATDGRLRWRGEIVAELVEGDAILRPRILILADESLSGPDLEGVQDRLNLWLRHHINTQLELVASLAEPADLEGTARGIAFQLSEHLGILPRAQVADEVKTLDQDVRAKMRKHGIKFGAYHIYLPLSLKPAPRELALILFALKNGGIRQPGVTDLPHTVLSGRTSFEIDPEVSPRLYEVAGFKVAGKRAVRVDILERLADIIRPLIALDPKRYQGELPPGAAEGNGFRVTVEMTSLLGCAGEEFASILNSLGYRVRRTPKPAEAPVAAVEALPEAIAAEGEASAASIEASLASPDEIAEIEAPVEETTLGVDATPAEAAPEAAATPVEPTEPQFDEIWFPAGRRPEHKRPAPPRRDPIAATAPAAEAGERAERPRRDNSGPRRPHFDKDKPRNERPRDDRGAEGKPRKFDNGNSKGKTFDRPPREKREPVFDPDSPFAALAALRNRKPE